MEKKSLNVLFIGEDIKILSDWKHLAKSEGVAKRVKLLLIEDIKNLLDKNSKRIEEIKNE